MKRLSRLFIERLACRDGESCGVTGMNRLMVSGLMIAGCAVAGMAATAGDDVTTGDENPKGAPERVIILSGNKNGASPEVMAVMYDTSELHFNDPSAPRFLFVDREGNTALGIGGYIEATGMYDFDGAIDNNGFVTNQISVPYNPKLRNRLRFDASHSRLFLRLVRRTRLGMLTAYVENSFAQGADGYGFNVKQAYLRLGNVQAGYSRSLFNDGASASPTIDYQGTCGNITGTNGGVSYTPLLGGGFKVGIAAEMPSADYTLGSDAETISQRVPDIPAYIQYGWNGGSNHVRLSGIFRDLSYRDMVSGTNRLTAGWGVQLSGVTDCTDYVTLYYQAVYGQGIARYINDLSGYGYDLLPSDEPGRLQAPHSLSLTGTVQFNVTKDLEVSGTYSFNRLYNQSETGGLAYRRAAYVAVNAFYTCFEDMQVGVEYLHGSRHNMDGDYGCANRIMAMVKYSF